MKRTLLFLLLLGILLNAPLLAQNNLYPAQLQTNPALLSGANQPQALPAGTYFAPQPAYPVQPTRSSQVGGNRGTYQFTIDYVEADANFANLNGELFTYYAWGLNQSHSVACPNDTTDNGTLKYAIVRFDSLYNSQTGESYNKSTTITTVDSIGFLYNHQNVSGLNDTLIVKILQRAATANGVQYAGAPGDVVTNTVLWADTIVTSTSLTTSGSLNLFFVKIATGGVTIPAGEGWLVMLDYRGPDTDVFNLADGVRLPCGSGEAAAVSTFPDNSFFFLNFLQRPDTTTCNNLSGVGRLVFNGFTPGCQQFYLQNFAITADVTLNVFEASPSWTFPASATDTLICPGDTIIASGNVSGGSGNYSFLWSGGVSGIVTIVDPTSETTEITASAIVPGTYYFYVTVTDLVFGFSFTDSVEVVVLGNCPGPLSVSLPTVPNQCSGTIYTVVPTVTGGTPPYFYSWSNGASNTTIDITTTGTYSLTVTDQNATTASANTAITFTTASPPCGVIPMSILVFGSGTVCAGTPTTLDVLAFDGTGTYTYNWSGPSGFTSSNAQITVSPTVTTTYTVTVTDGLSVAIDSAQVITTTASPPCPVTAPLTLTMSNDTTTCQGDFVELSADVSGGTGNYTYFWSTGDTNPSISVNPSNTTSYSVVVQDGITNLNGSVTVFTSIAAPPCSVNFSVSGQVLQPNGSPVRSGTATLYDISNTIAGYDTIGFVPLDTQGRYSFDFGLPLFRSVTIMAKPDNVVYPDLLPTYLGDSVQWNNAASYYFDTSNTPVPAINCQQLFANAATGNNVIRGVVITNIVGKQATPIEDEDIILSQTPPGLPVAYQKTSSTGSFVISGLGIATYEITADVAGIPMNDNTNSITFSSLNDTVDVTIVVDSNVVTASWIVSSARQPLLADAVKLYPNPTSGAVWITLGSVQEQVQVIVTSITGETVHQQTANRASTLQLNMDTAAGVYFVTIANSEGHKLVKRLIVQ